MHEIEFEQGELDGVVVGENGLELEPDKALSFDGVNDHVVVANNALLQFGTGSFTLEAVIKLNSFNTKGSYFISKRQDTEIDAPQFHFNVKETGALSLGTYYNGDSSIICPESTIQLNRLYHVAGVRNSNGIHQLFVDGVKVAEKTLTVRNVTNNQPMWFGDDNRDNYATPYSGRMFNGIIDDVRVWNTARTQQQIQNNMNAELTGSETGLVGYWKFNEGEGATAYDSTANGNDGTIYGATWVDGLVGGYNELGTRTSESVDLSPLGTNPGLQIAWQSTEPEGTSVKVETAVTDGQDPPAEENWVEQTNNTAVSNIPTGSLMGKYLWLRETLATTDPNVTPTLSTVVYYGGVVELKDAYSGSITRTFNVSSAEIANTSSITWNATVPTGTSLTIQTSLRKDSDFSKLSNPSNLPTGSGYGCSFSPDGVYLAIAHSTSPYLTIYKRSGDIFTKLTNPASLPPHTARSCSFSPCGTYLAVAHSTSPYITIYKRDGDVFTKLSNPTIFPTGLGYGCTFSPCGTYLAVAHSTSPYITIYKRDGDTFTKLTNPTILPTDLGNGCAFSPCGTYLAVAHYVSPFITIYKRDGDVFTKLSNPTILPTGLGNGCAFSPCGTYLSVAHYVSPFITIYKRDGDTFTKLSNPTLPNDTGYGCAFSPDSTYLVVAHSQGYCITIYRRDGDTFTKLTDPSTVLPNTGRGCGFSPDNVHLVMTHYDSPYITIYKTPPWSEWKTATKGQAIPDVVKHRNLKESSLRYKATLTTSDINLTPQLQDITLSIYGNVVDIMYADTYRQVAFGESAVYIADTLRIVVTKQGYSADTLREVNALLHGYFGDTSRKPALPYDYSADTLRKVASGVLFIDSENILQPLGWYVSGLPLPKLAIRDYSEQIPEHHGEIDHGFDLDVGDYMLTIVSPRTTDKEKLRRELMYAFQTSWGVRDLKIYNTTYKVRLDGSIQIKQLPHYIIAEVPLKVGR